MSEHPDARDLLGPYVMGTLEPCEERELEHHLESCASCREEAQELRLAHERFADLASSTGAPPEDLKVRVLAGIPRREASRRVPTWVAMVAVAICVLAVLGAIITPDLFGGRAMASANLSPTGRAPGAGGEVSIRGTGENMEMRPEAWGLPPCKSKQYYDPSRVNSDERVSAVSF